MLNIYKSSVVLLSALLLSACLEVKDKSDDKVVDVLTEQNKILQEQANQTAQTKTTISLVGLINNASTGTKAVNATAKIKIGSTFSEPVAAASGAFQIDNLPADSDYELVVHSTTNSFADRTYFGRTRAANSPGKIYQDLGVLTVAVGVERKFKILNAATSVPITGLTLLANSNVGNGSGYEQYLHKSTYDPSTQEYKIVLPERLGVTVSANLDINNDGKVEYRIDNNSILYITDPTDTNPIYLVDLNANAKVKVRISLVDSLLQPITGASVNVKDQLNGSINGIYEVATNQYVIDAIVDSTLTVMIPSFSFNGVKYSSSTVQIIKTSLDEKNYVANVSSLYSYSSNFSFGPAADKVFNVVVQPGLQTIYSNLSVVGFSSIIDPSNTFFKVFYSGAIELKPDSVSFLKRDVLRIVKGSDNTTDLILPGNTLIENVNEPVAIDAQLSLDNTLLSVTSKAPLAPSYNYSFSVETIKDLFSNTNVNLYSDSRDFYVPNTNPFSINEIKLDNNDYYSKGVVIKPVNTAGVAASLYYGSSSYVYIFLPNSIEGLKNLTLRKEQITQNGTTVNSIDTYNIVVNGSINTNKTNVVSLAYNENTIGNAASAVKGAAVADGQWYYTGTYIYLQDNTNSNSNSVTFSYSFETKAGVIETGSITLPVL